MPNKLITSNMIMAEMLRLVHQEANFIGNINTSYDKKFAKAGGKVGDTIEVRLPNQYTVRRGRRIKTQETHERKKKIKLTRQCGIDIEFTSKELTLDLDRFSERFLEPAAKTLVASIESEMLSAVHPKITSWSWIKKDDELLPKILEGNERLAAKLCPDDNKRFCWMSTHESARLIDQIKGLFNPQEEMARLYRTGALGRTANNTFYTNTHLGTFSDELLSNVSLEAGERIVLRQRISRTNKDDQATTPPINELRISIKKVTKTGSPYVPLGPSINPGTGIEIQDLLILHPQTKKRLPYSWRGVLTGCEQIAVDELKVTIDPPIYWQEEPTINSNVAHINGETSLGENAKITLTLMKPSLSMPLKLMIQAHRDAFVLGTADLVMPDGVDFKSRQKHNGISMRVIRKYDYKEDTFPCRIDILYGYEYLRDDMAHKYFCE